MKRTKHSSSPSAMRDVSVKPNTLRTARAVARLTLGEATVRAVRSGAVPKADPIGVARIAGIQAAKNTSLLIPYCHQVPLDFVSVDIRLDARSATVETVVKAIWKTGVEMEALTAASAAALTLYDMLKIIDDSMEIVSLRLVEKRGGKSDVAAFPRGLKAAVLVLSDSASRGARRDTSGTALVERLRGLGISVPVYRILPDERKQIERLMKELADRGSVDILLTTGGTGLGPRDVTPDATAAVVERRLEGVEEAMRRYGQDRVPTAMLSRAVAGVRSNTLIVNLPGSRGGAEDGVSALFPAIVHAFGMMKGEGHDHTPPRAGAGAKRRSARAQKRK